VDVTGDGTRTVATPEADCDWVIVAVVPVMLTEVTVDGPADDADESAVVMVTAQFDSQLNTESGDKSPWV